ncbi:MAG: penicillin-binding transpeptidase domain-containing protein [Planctomycetota bacterium]
MSGSRRRIRQLAGLFVLGLVLVVSHLSYVMVVQHQVWLGRSYKNRWAFRDVPTRRGAITDRHGRWLAEDTACSALKLHYWAFRRYHPVGAAVEGANLALRRRGSEVRLGYRDAARAFRILLETGVDWLRKDKEVSDEAAARARDLQFYVSSVLSALTNASHGKIRLRLRQAAAAGSREACYRVLGLDGQELAALFATRLAELSALERRLATALQQRYATLPPQERERRFQKQNLWTVLGKARQKREAWLLKEREDRKGTAPDQILRPIDDQLPYEVALYVASIRERHPGLVVHPAVRRVRNTLPGHTDLASLEPLLGRVRAFGRADQEKQEQALLEQQLEQMEVELDELPAGDADLSDQLQQQVRARARKVVASVLRSRGRVGSSGVEQVLDPELRGGPGLRFVERTRRVPERRLWGSFNVTPGIDVRLTFDLRLQVLLEQAMDEVLAGLPTAKGSAVAVIDPQTGDVLALASRQPDGKLPAAVSWPSAGDIGSVGKPFVLLEHLDAMRHGRPHASHQDYRECVGMYGRQLGCDHSHFGDAKDPVKALGKSCNFFFYQAAEGLSGKGVLDAYRRFGLSPDVAAASARFQGWHQQHIDGLWLRNPVKRADREDARRRAIGYGVEANVLSIARAYAGLATGRLLALSLVRDQSRPAPVDLGLHPDDLAVARDGLAHCVREGTAARERRLFELGVLAKTGTATVGKSTSKINNAWLAGYLTRERPTLAFAAVVYSVRGYGAARSGPLVTAFLEKLRNDPELREEYL